MNIYIRTCVEGVHHHYAHMISGGYASIDDVSVNVKACLHQAFSQVVDVMNLCFIHTLLCNNHINKFQAHDDPGSLTRTPCAVEHDVHGSHCSEVQSELRFGKVRPPTKDLFHNNFYARDDQGGNPGQVIEGSTVSYKL